MPIDHTIVDDLIITRLKGRVTDEELLTHYQQPALWAATGRWLELVDGSAVDGMDITPQGQARLAEFLSVHVDRLRGGRVAMVANSDLTYGMFRMWEIRRENLDYTVRVFRDLDAGREWITHEAE